MLNLDEDTFCHKKNYLWRKRFSEILRSEVCTKWERWRQLKNHVLTKSQCKKYKRIMRQYKSSLLSCRKCKNRWILRMIQENFKKWNQITVGDCLTFPVRLQWSQVLVPCWAATNACLLTHGIHRDYRKTCSVINFLRLIHPEIILKEFTLTQHKENEDQFHKLQGRGLFSQEMTNKIVTQFQCRHLQKRRRIWVLQCWWCFRRILWLDSKDSKNRSCNSTNSFIHNHFWFGEYDSKIKPQLVPIFYRKQCYGSKKWRLLILEELKSSRSVSERNFQILKCWTRRLLLLWTRLCRIPNSTRRSVSRNRKPRKRTGFHELDRPSSWSTITFEWLALMTQYLITPIYSLLHFMTITFRNSIQDGMKFCYLCQRFHPKTYWKTCKNWEYVSLRNSKPYWNCRTWRFITRYRCPIVNIEDNGEEECRSETSITELWRQTRENWNRSSGQES